MLKTRSKWEEERRGEGGEGRSRGLGREEGMRAGGKKEGVGRDSIGGCNKNYDYG